MNDVLEVRVESLDDVVRVLTMATSTIEEHLDELDRRVAQLGADWSGAAREAYAHSQSRWRQEISVMMEALERAHEALARSRTRYARVEALNASSWKL
ncbi:MAG: WXG100 family type VII secretion target [Cryobacterium sp.]|nr:WXG100 family type VII secretion target [Cryobacterium sp.]